MKFSDYLSIQTYVEEEDVQVILNTALKGACLNEDIPCQEYGVARNNELVSLLNEKTVGKYTVILGDLVRDEIFDLKNNLEKYTWIYTLLADEKSKETFILILAQRLTRDVRYSAAAFDGGGEQYFDKNLVCYPKDCVYVDCGAFDGCTAAAFVCHNPAYKSLYLYEPMDQYFEECRAFGKQLGEHVVVRKAGVFDQNTTLHFAAAVPGSSKVTTAGELAIDAVALDTDIQEPIGFLKMDIEGSESAALRGSRAHIQTDAPVLALCVYHKPADLWQIPEQVLSYNQSYTFYLRHHTPGTDETVLYGIPDRQDLYPAQDIFSRDADLQSLATYGGYCMDEVHRLNASVKYLITQLENHKRSTAELKCWNEQQEAAKQDLLKQLHNAENANIELRDWNSQLEEAKAYLTGQWHNYEQLAQERAEQLDAVTQQARQQEEAIATLENTCKKLRYQLRQEIEKPWYQKLRKGSQPTVLDEYERGNHHGNV